MIDEKKLIEEMEKTFPDEFLHEKKFCLARCSFMDLLKEMINELTKVDCGNCSRRKFYQKGYQEGLNANKWIPCSERFPEYNKVVLTYDGSCYDVRELCEGDEDEEDEEDYWEDNYGFFHDYDTVIAWMPLPEPCKGE